MNRCVAVAREMAIIHSWYRLSLNVSIEPNLVGLLQHKLLGLLNTCPQLSTGVFP